MRKITFDTFDDAIGAVEDFSDGLGCNVTITSEDDGTFMYFGHGEKVATWTARDGKMCSGHVRKVPIQGTQSVNLYVPIHR